MLLDQRWRYTRETAMAIRAEDALQHLWAWSIYGHTIYILRSLGIGRHDLLILKQMHK